MESSRKNISILLLTYTYSLHTALSLAYLGAPEGTETSQELVNLLGLDPLHTEDYLYNYLRVLLTQKELTEKLNTNIQLANKVVKLCHDTEHNNTQINDTQHD